MYDICHAAEMLTRFTEGKTFEDYSQDDMLRSAVERQFKVIGEALNQLPKIDMETASQIDSYQRIIAFRNILIHGYAQVDNRIVWGLLQTRLPTMLALAGSIFGCALSFSSA